MEELNQEQYQVLFAFRCALRQYLQWSASHAARPQTPATHEGVPFATEHPCPQEPQLPTSASRWTSQPVFGS